MYCFKCLVLHLGYVGSSLAKLQAVFSYDELADLTCDIALIGGSDSTSLLVWLELCPRKVDLNCRIPRLLWANVSETCGKIYFRLRATSTYSQLQSEGVWKRQE